MSFTAASVMDRAAAFLNDSALSIFTYVAQIPYLNAALDELQEIFEENNVPITNRRSSVLVIPAGTVTISFSTTPALPSDLIEIQKLGERNSGTTDSFTEMVRKEFLPQTEVQTTQLIYWSWINEQIKFIGATSARDVELDYIASLFTAVTTSTNSITVINGKSFLAYRTAALCAQFIGENPERAQALNDDAVLALSRSLNITVKGRQSIVTRRQPFMAAWRGRTYIT